ncbi:uncharacterized protein LOC119294111 isoform X1 [Triticum dicoccoides]|uniref:uncharacterized protein LOC119294111 isoform X1 n=2 Tax=Triticum dicoccoides TaxID=85692 RepID=UPI000E7AC331|nr:uncharacterized protein LOC119294111 isoform X1 [Triticum dicoccoides]
MKIDTKKGLFRDMVRKIFNVPSGSRPVELLRRNEPHMLREPYRVGSRAPMKRCIQVLKNADVDDVVTINRSWVLLCIALVLSPGTGNMVPLEYIASLVDMDKIDDFAWDEHFLATALKEVKKYQRKREEGRSGFWIGGCLPMFAIIYMDFVDVPRSLVSQHRINYSLPRACFVCNNDFKLVEEIDKNKLSLDKIEFGKQNVRAHSYCKQIPEHLIPIYEKHKKLHAVEVKNVLLSFGQVIQSVFCKRVASILVEANSTTTSTKEQIFEDVTFHAPAGNASSAANVGAVDQTSVPPNTSPAPHMSVVAQQPGDDREVAGDPDSNQSGNYQDIGLDKR